jgi:hypothetical protein
MSKLFTLSEAQALVPVLERLLNDAIAAKAEASALEGSLRALAAKITASGGFEVDPVKVAEKKLLRDRTVRQAQQAIDEIHQTGCHVKDLDVGLLDFPALLGGEEVYLCWKLGEPRIEYWHRIEDGFSGRRRITDEFGEAPPLRPN